MSDSDIDDEVLNYADELTVLKQRADVLGISYSSRIGVDALREKITRHLNDTEEEKADEPAPMNKAQMEASIRKKLQDEELKLVRVRITNLNPLKKDHRGEIFTVANKYLGIVKKYIPYGEVTEEGYHIPHVLYTQLKERKFLNIKTHRDRATGQIVVTQNWVPEFALEVLPQLTEKELRQLAAAQAAAGGVDPT
jgi:hypothetical protein